MCDGGANQSVTNDVTALYGIKHIPPHYIGGIDSGIKCISKGWYNITTTDCTTISVPMFYAPNANETVISPKDIVNTYPNQYDSVLQNFDVGGNCSQLIFYKKEEPYPSHIHSHDNKMQFFMKEGFHYTAISLVKYNNYYYIDEPIISAIYSTSLQNITADFIHSTTSVTLYNLWYYWLGHPGHHTMRILHKYADGVPVLKVKNPFFKCKHCYPNITKNMKG